MLNFNKNENELLKKQFEHLEDDGSHFFSVWGSKNLLLTINEEIDNQIGACPKYASLKYDATLNGSTLVFENDGITPDYERMEKMYYIGKSYSDKRGASVCGVGQIAALVAGRQKPNGNATLTFVSVHRGKETIFFVRANGTKCSLSGGVLKPTECEGIDRVRKTFEGMDYLEPSNKKRGLTLEKLKAIISAKIYPYAKEHPEFKYYLNSEEIIPQSLIYEGVEDERITRSAKKTYEISYHDVLYHVNVEMANVHKYVKPDGFRKHDEDKLSEYDRVFDLNPCSYGVYVNLGGTYTISGGQNSWKFIGERHHTTKSGIRILIDMPTHGNLKEAIFAESPNKSETGISLEDVFDYDGTQVFYELIHDIRLFILNNVTGRATPSRRCTKNNFNDVMGKYGHMFSLVFEKIPLEDLKLMKNLTIEKIYEYADDNGLLGKQRLTVSTSITQNDTYK